MDWIECVFDLWVFLILGWLGISCKLDLDMLNYKIDKFVVVLEKISVELEK